MDIKPKNILMSERYINEMSNWLFLINILDCFKEYKVMYNIFVELI